MRPACAHMPISNLVFRVCFSSSCVRRGVRREETRRYIARARPRSGPLEGRANCRWDEHQSTAVRDRGRVGCAHQRAAGAGLTTCTSRSAVRVYCVLSIRCGPGRTRGTASAQWRCRRLPVAHVGRRGSRDGAPAPAAGGVAQRRGWPEGRWHQARGKRVARGPRVAPIDHTSRTSTFVST